MCFISQEDKLNYLKARIKLNEKTSCWEWTKALHLGYGYFSVKRKNYLAHRLMYELLIGEIPKGLFLDHLCRNRSCCNPAHLEPLTLVENCRRGNSYGRGAIHQKVKTHCAQGHEFNDLNTKLVGNNRVCILCRRLWNKRYKNKNKDKA